MLRLVLTMSMTTALLACSSPDTLTPQRLPGIKVALPGWGEVARVEEWASGAITRQHRTGRRVVTLQWSLGVAADIDDMGLRLEPLTRHLGEAVTAEPPHPRMINGHEGQDIVLSGALEGHYTGWYCAEHQRVYGLFFIGPQAVYDGVTESVRCHDGPAPARAAAEFARFEPPPGFEREVSEEGDDPSLRGWSDGTSTVQLVASSVAPGVKEALEKHEKLALSTNLGRTVDTFERTIGADGQTRWLMEYEHTEDDVPLDVREVVWVCRSDRYFYALHVSPKGSVKTADANAVLLSALCP